MNERNFHIEAPPVPEHFIETRERTLNLIQSGESYGAVPRRSIPRTAVLAVIAVLLLTAGAAAAVNSFGILDFLNWNKMPAPSGAEEAIRSALGSAEGEFYIASVDEVYFDGSSFMVVVRYELKNPQNTLFVNSLSGYWRDDEGFYRVGMTSEFQGPEDPWQTLNEYEDAIGGTRMRISAVDPQIILDDSISWGSASTMLQQPDESLIYVLQGMISQPIEETISVSIRCSAVPYGTEKPTEFEEIPITLTPSETVWQAEYIPDSEGEGWTVEGVRITSGRMLMRTEIGFVCAPGTLKSDMDYWNIVMEDTNGNKIPLMDGGGETEALSDGSMRCLLQASMLSPDGKLDVLMLYLERDGELPLGPIECRLAE